MINKQTVSFGKVEFTAIIYNAIQSCNWLFNNLEDYLTNDELHLEIEDLAIRLIEKLEIIEKELNEL